MNLHISKRYSDTVGEFNRGCKRSRKSAVNQTIDLSVWGQFGRSLGFANSIGTPYRYPSSRPIGRPGAYPSILPRRREADRGGFFARLPLLLQTGRPYGAGQDRSVIDALFFIMTLLIHHDQLEQVITRIVETRYFS